MPYLHCYHQELLFQFPNFQLIGLVGLAMVLVGGIMRVKVRLELRDRAKMGSIVSTAKLMVVDGQQLITDGWYKHIRHPLYLAELLRNFGWAIMLTSFWGFIPTNLSSLHTNKRVLSSIRRCQ